MSCRTVPVVFMALSLTCGAHSTSPVQKVLQLIDQMSTKVQNDVTATAAAFADAAKLCDKEMTDKSYAKQSSEENIAKLTSLVEDNRAKIGAFDSTISETSSSISSTEGEIASAVGMRKKEHDDFVGAEKELLDMVTELHGAADSIKKSVALAQLTPQAKHALNAELVGLSTLVEASFVTLAERSKVQAFLQAQADSEDMTSTKDSTILETLAEMTDKAEGTLSNTRKTEMENAHAHAMLRQGLESEVANLNAALNTATYGRQFATESMAQQQKDLSIEQTTYADDKQYAKDLQHSCQMRAQDWEIDSRDGQAELTALATAKNILTKKFALLQTQVATSSLRTAVRARVWPDDTAEDAKARALRSIEQLGRRLHSTMLVSLSYRASADPLGKIRGLVEDMIAKLLQEAAEEATQEAFCRSETAATTKSKSIKQGKLDKTTARIDKATSAVAQLSEQIAQLSQELAEIDQMVSQSTAQRTQEKNEFRKAEKDFSESEDACASALEVLREYYEGASLAQISSKTAGQVQQKGSDGIMQVLQFAESDFAKLLADARMTEDMAQNEFDATIKDAKMTAAQKSIEVKGKESEVKSLKTALSNYDEDKSGLNTELDALVSYLNELKPQCETQLSSYADRKAKRENEIDGLKESLRILENP